MAKFEVARCKYCGHDEFGRFVDTNDFLDQLLQGGPLKKIAQNWVNLFAHPTAYRVPNYACKKCKRRTLICKACQHVWGGEAARIRHGEVFYCPSCQAKHLLDSDAF